MARMREEAVKLRDFHFGLSNGKDGLLAAWNRGGCERSGFSVWQAGRDSGLLRIPVS